MKYSEKFFGIKKEINSFLLSLVDKHGYFVSITPVGSHAEEKEMESINDIDVVFVFDTLDRNKWNTIISELENFTTKHSDDNFGVIIETRFGPFKMESGKSITIQIHALFFDVQSFRDYAKMSPLVVSDWFRFAPLFGQALVYVAPIPFLTATNIIKARGGVDYSLEQLNNGINIALTVGFDGEGKLTRVIEKLPQNNKQKAETCFKSIKNILLNIWKLEKQENVKASDSELETLSKNILGNDNFLIIKELEMIYKKARSGEVIQESEIADSQQKARNILILIKNYLGSCENN